MGDYNKVLFHAEKAEELLESAKAVARAKSEDELDGKRKTLIVAELLDFANTHARIALAYK